MSELFVGRWVKCSERLPEAPGLRIVRSTTEPLMQMAHMETWYYPGNITHWLDPLDLANDEATVERAALAILAKVPAGYGMHEDEAKMYAKAALGAAGRGQ